MSQTLSNDQATTAIYIDFEGRKNESPVLLGILNGDEFRQVVLDERYFGLARSKGLEIGSLQDVLAEIAAMAERENRVIVAWSNHELDVVRECKVDPHTLGIFEQRYRNAIHVAKKWRRSTMGDVTWSRDSRRGVNQLERYLKLVGHERARILGQGNTGGRLRDVAAGLVKKGGDHETLTSTMKGKWTKVLSHNSGDCLGLRAVTLAATQHLDRIFDSPESSSTGTRRRGSLQRARNSRPGARRAQGSAQLELMAASDIAKLFGVSRQNVYKWMDSKSAQFPECAGEVGGIQVWRRREVEAWRSAQRRRRR